MNTSFGIRVQAEEVTANVQPRIFQESFSDPNTVMYVNDVTSGVGPALWRELFIGDTAPAADRKTPGGGHPTGPIVTLAREAIAIPDQAHGRIQLHMADMSRHESSMDEQKGEKGIHSMAALPRYGDAIRRRPPNRKSDRRLK